ncbi:response regulator transcription factor [Massilia putida]|uniref:response regulator transcription factor n=1 Tax=Massilia putida TaxID=1141883 RepID=UPI00095358DA|nr:response regulator transcription factor [Massilia putida]
MNVVLVDDHALVRAGIRTLIDQIADFVVVGEASDVVDAMELVRQVRPHIVVTDIGLGEENGLELVPRIRAESPRSRVVILSMHASEELVAEALRLGASAYLLKESAPNELEIAMRAVARDENYLSPSVSKKMIDRFVRPAAVADKQLDILTPRQQQILALFASRKSTKEIAYELDLSEKTIAAHRAQIMERTGVRDLVGLVLWAMKHGLVKPAD